MDSFREVYIQYIGIQRDRLSDAKNLSLQFGRKPEEMARIPDKTPHILTIDIK